MAGVMSRSLYISDDGVTYRLAQDASNQVAAGNVLTTLSSNLPKRYKPRFILAAHPVSGRERRIVIGDPANALWVGGTGIIVLPDFNALAAPTNFVVRGRIGERRLA